MNPTRGVMIDEHIENIVWNHEDKVSKKPEVVNL